MRTVAVLALSMGSVFGLAYCGMGDGEIPTFTYEVVAEYPHDPAAFCQGLEFQDGIMYEGTGRKGESNIRKYKLGDTVLINKFNLTPKYFGEGITVWKDKIIQLTWRSKTAFVYDKKSFDKMTEFEYEGEGWGLTHNEEHLIMSHGSSRLTFLDPETFNVVRTIYVTAEDNSISKLNELEWIEGEIYANIWQEDRIARIDPKNGNVTAWIDLSGLRRENPDPEEEVLNGIAYDSKEKRIFLTGKYWPTIYHVKFKPKK